MNTEIYKTITDYPNYEVSNLGNVRNKKTGQVLKPGKNNCGYLKVDLRKEGKRKHFLIHRLVSTVFIPNPETKNEVNHINGIKTDNRVENLEWVTHSENVNHSFRTGLNKITNNPNPKQKVRCIETNQEFESQLSASKYFGCNHGSIHYSIYKGHSVKKQYHFELIE